MATASKDSLASVRRRDEVEVALRIALRSHYRGLFATRLGLSLAEHYAGEATRIAHGPLADAVRGSRSAFGRAEGTVRGEDARCRVEAEEELRFVFTKLPPKLGVHLGDRDVEAFWTMVREVLEPTF
jgi:hypothetical protein